MDVDFIVEESSNPKKNFFTCVFILILVAASFYAFNYYANQDFVKTKNVTIELGAQVPTNISLYLKGKNLADYILDVSTVHVDNHGNTDSVGEYSYKVTKGSKVERGKIFVKDTTAPQVEVQNLTIGLNEEFLVDDFIVSCFDLSEVCDVSYANKKDENLSDKEGTYEFSINITDKYKNAVTKKVTLIVKKGASLANVKAEDLVITNLYPKDEEWNQTLTYRFEKGLQDNTDALDAKILELTNYDFSEKYDKEIKNKMILFAYNQYGFVLGLSVRLEFVDGQIIYVPQI